MYHWIGPGQSLDIGPFHLESPLVYAGRSDTSNEPSAVLLPLPVELLSDDERQLQATRSVRLQAEHGSYTGYAKMSPAARGEYLAWLAAGRPAVRNESLLSFYLGGLERRAIEHPEDAGTIWAELWRLAQENGEANPLFVGQVSRLQWFLFPTVAAEIGEDQARALAARTVANEVWYEESQTQLSLLLFWAAGSRGALPSWLAYTAAHTAHETRRRIVTGLAAPEHENLFAIRFAQLYGETLPFHSLPEATRTLTYRPVNSSMNPRTVTWPDPLRLADRWRVLYPEFIQLYEACQSELLQFARLLRKGVDRASPAAWEALPAPLRQDEHPFRQRLSALFAASFEKNGHATIDVGRLAALFDSQPYDRVSPARSRHLADSLELCGLGIEPEIRLTARAYRLGQAVVVYPFPEGIAGIDLSRAGAVPYLANSFFLKICFYVAKAAGNVSREHVAAIATAARKLFEPGPLQRRQSRAQAALLLARDFDLRGESMPNYKQPEIRADLEGLLCSLAANNGCHIEDAAERALITVWNKLGYDAAGVKTQHAAAAARGFSFVPRELGADGSRTSPPAIQSIPFAIDYEALAALLEETRHVQRALADAMDIDETRAANPSPTPSVSPIPTASSSLPAPPPYAPISSGPPPRYAPLYNELIGRDVWPMAEAEALARSHKQMLAGALEAINAWAFDEFGEQLLWDDGDQLFVERALLGSNSKPLVD